MWDYPSPQRKKNDRTRDHMNEILMERSPQKWKTMYRDQYRKFMESPKHGANEEILHEEHQDGMHYQNEQAQGEIQM